MKDSVEHIITSVKEAPEFFKQFIPSVIRQPLSDDLLIYYHDNLTLIMVVAWLVISFAGYKIADQKTITKISYFLIGFSLFQEIIDWVNRIYLDTEYLVSWRADLPLQFCVMGFYFSIIGIYLAEKRTQQLSKIEQFLFDCAYVLGFAGGFQALLAVDLTGINNMLGAFALNWAHSLIILNVLWLIFAYGKRFTLFSIFRAYGFILFIIIPVGLINYILIQNGIDANYMFLCEPPNVDSSFFIGEWPTYLFWLALIYFLYVLILYIPFKIVDFLKSKI